MERPWDVRASKTFHKKAVPGQEFRLRVKLVKGGCVTWPHELLMEAVQQALLWVDRAPYAEIVDCQGNVVVSQKRMARLWCAQKDGYGKPTKEAPYRVRAEVIFPGCIYEYYALRLLDAVDFATFWHEDSWDDPAWVEVLGPNGAIVLSRKMTEKMYHAEITASGRCIMQYVVRPSNTVMVGNGVAVRLPEILSEKRIA